MLKFNADDVYCWLQLFLQSLNEMITNHKLLCIDYPVSWWYTIHVNSTSTNLCFCLLILMCCGLIWLCIGYISLKSGTDEERLWTSVVTILYIVLRCRYWVFLFSLCFALFLISGHVINNEKAIQTLGGREAIQKVTKKHMNCIYDNFRTDTSTSMFRLYV